MYKAVQLQLEKEPDRKLYLSTIGIIVAALLVWSFRGVNITGFDPRGTQIASNVFLGILSPDLAFLFDFRTAGGVPYLLFETIAIAFLGTIFGSLLAIPISFLMSPSDGSWSLCRGTDHVFDFDRDDFPFIRRCYRKPGPRCT